jgi:hypothetical protein
VLARRPQEAEAETAELASQAAVLREVMIRTADAHAQEQECVAALAGELGTLDLDGGQVERDRVSVVLKALRATITNYMATREVSRVELISILKWDSSRILTPAGHISWHCTRDALLVPRDCAAEARPSA